MHHPIVALREVSFSFGDGPVLDRVDLQIPEGAFIGVVGPSGAGKTTLLRLAAGMLSPTSGEVQFGEDDRGRRVRLAVVPQLETVDWNFPVTVEEVVLLGRATDAPLPWGSKDLRREARSILD